MDKGGAYGNARIPNWPHRTAPLALGLSYRSCIMTRGNILGQATYCPISFFLTCWCNLILSLWLMVMFLLTAFWFQSCPVWTIFFHYWVSSSRHGRMARSVVGCWMARAIGHLYRSHTYFIPRRIVIVTKAAIWSHPLTLLSMVGLLTHLLQGIHHTFTELLKCCHHHLILFYRSGCTWGFCKVHVEQVRIECLMAGHFLC